MGIVSFLITNNSSHHVFNKNTFKYMNINYTSGTTGSIYLYFAAEGDIVDPDLITLTVPKAKLSEVAKTIATNLAQGGFHEYTTSNLKALSVNKDITAITYTAG